MSLFRRSTISLLRRVAAKPARAAQWIELGHRRAAFDQWLRDRGDQTRRLDYRLSMDSVVWDVGAFEGQWTSDIFGRFACRVHAFEPLPAHFARVRQRFAANRAVDVHPFGLGPADATLPMVADGDASSLVTARSGSPAAIPVQVREIGTVLHELGDEQISLLKLNIEGAEYDLLAHVIARGLARRFADIQVQFHDFVPDAIRRREELTAALQRTHERSWCYPFVWENWTARP